MVYRETGPLPLIYSRIIKMISYWARAKSNKFLSSLVITTFNDSKWSNDIKIILCNLNMGDAYLLGFSNINKFLSTMKSRMYEYGFKFLDELICDSNKCEMYEKFALYEDVNILPNYMSLKLDNACTRRLARFRCRNHKLLIERGSWLRPKLLRNDRICQMCLIVEDEYHFVLICPLYSTLREHYIKPKYWENPSISKFVELMNGNKSDQYQLCHFIRKAEELYEQIHCL